MQSFVLNSSIKIYWSGFSAIAFKEIRRFLRIYSQTLLTPIIMVGLYFLIFGKVLGDRMGDLHGHSYTSYIAPGLIIMAVFNNAYGNVAHSFFMHKFQGIITSILVSPTPVLAVFMGFMTGGIARGMAVGLLVFLATSLFAGFDIYNVWLFLFIMFLSSFLFSVLGLLTGLFANTFDEVSIFPIFILTPLTYLGGVFFPISILSGTVQIFAKFNPVYYIIDAFRFSMLGISETNVNLSLSILIIISMVCCGILFFIAKNDYLRK